MTMTRESRTRRGAPSCPVCAMYGVETRVRIGRPMVAVPGSGSPPLVGALCMACREAEREAPEEIERCTPVTGYTSSAARAGGR